ncbi:hypothetical protein GGR52DRAFT_542689 [Hypoxylon sp. FL1284]|nr:hypothetical protein GGR52DRAFT_542689 [Hypoxylon sp. FL1284]
MHRPSASTRITLATAAILFFIATLSYRSSFSLSTTIIPFSTAGTACQIWPDSPELSLKQLQYQDCENKTVSPQLGDVSVLGNPDRCLVASSRLDQYRPVPGRNWTEVRWGQVQRQCAARKARISPLEHHTHHVWRQPVEPQQEETAPKEMGERVAVVLRTWDNYEYTENRLAWLRALIAETVLQRDENYEVYFLVHVKDADVDLEDDVVYDQVLQETVPEEFRDMALLFNQRTLEAWYPLVEQHSAQEQMYQALQIFSQKFQQYDYIWQLEMDLRFTGHVHDTLQSATSFARARSRRNLWERNGRFYIPGLHNNSYDAFSDAVDAEIGDTGVWGPAYTSEFVPQGPQPPSRLRWNWGVGEEADLISFMPMIDPQGTDWVYEYNIHGFADGPETPRRVAIVSITRSSRRLLQLMSEAQQERGQWIVSEASPETFALLHGLKAVTVPHPIYFNNDTDAEELDANINRGPPHTKAGGGSPSMLYTMHGWADGPWWDSSYWFTAETAAEMWKAYLDGEPLPPMMLHPVKEK